LHIITALFFSPTYFLDLFAGVWFSLGWQGLSFPIVLFSCFLPICLAAKPLTALIHASRFVHLAPASGGFDKHFLLLLRL
jgi:hypothetical protein